MKMKKMKGIDLFCASPASTAICSSMVQRSMVKNGQKSLHRLNSYLNDQYKTFTNNIHSYSPSNVPCISELPFTPRPSYREKTRKPDPLRLSDYASRRKSSADVSDLRHYAKYNYYKITDSNSNNNNNNNSSPSNNSARYLLGDSPFLDSLPESEDKLALVPSTPVFRSEERELRKCRSEARRLGSLMDAEREKKKKDVMRLAAANAGDQGVIKANNNSKHSNDRGGVAKYDDKLCIVQRQKGMGQSSRNDSLVVKSTTSSSSAQSRHQVVVLRVSLHCRGCEGKLRRHLSKMEGVTSFSIDLETKKVTVIGNVTPSSVLTSISKVKNAQFWPSPASASSSSSSSSSSNSSKTDFSY